MNQYARKEGYAAGILGMLERPQNPYGKWTPDSLAHDWDMGWLNGDADRRWHVTPNEKNALGIPCFRD